MVNIICASTVPLKCQLYNSIRLYILIGLIMFICKTKQSSCYLLNSQVGNKFLALAPSYIWIKTIYILHQEYIVVFMKNKTKTYFSFYSYTKFLMLGTKLKESVFFIEKCQYSHNVLLSLYYKQSQKNWAYSLDQKFPIYGQKQWNCFFCLWFYRL